MRRSTSCRRLRRSRNPRPSRPSRLRPSHCRSRRWRRAAPTPMAPARPRRPISSSALARPSRAPTVGRSGRTFDFGGARRAAGRQSRGCRRRRALPARRWRRVAGAARCRMRGPAADRERPHGLALRAPADLPHPPRRRARGVFAGALRGGGLSARGRQPTLRPLPSQ